MFIHSSILSFIQKIPTEPDMRTHSLQIMSLSVVLMTLNIYIGKQVSRKFSVVQSVP